MKKNTVSDPKRMVGTLKKRKTKRQKKMIMQLKLTFFSLIFIICIVGLAISLFWIKTKRAVLGVWNYDTVTSYQFDKSGEGSLIVPDNTYPFSYLIDRNLMFLDFEDASLSDMIFQYSVKNNTLSIINKSTGQELILKKQN